MKKISLALALVAAGLSFNAAAGTVTGTIDKIRVSSTSPELVYVKVNGTVTGAPSCATSTAFNFVYDTTDDANPHWLKLLLTAYSAGTPVAVAGLNFCTGIVEHLGSVSIQH